MDSSTGIPVVSMFSVREPDAAARDIHGLAGAGFGDALAVEHLVADFLLDLEAPLDPSFAFTVLLELGFVHLNHQGVCLYWKIPYPEP